MGDTLAEARRRARGEDLASLRRLDALLVRSGFRHEGRTAREWVAELAARGGSRHHYPTEAHEALRAFGPGAVPALLELLETERLSPTPRADSSIREHALRALLAMEPPPRCAVPVLLELMTSPGARLRRQALRGLVELRPRPGGLAVRRLLEACHDREDWRLRALGVDGLTGLDGPLPEAAEHEALARLSDENRYVRRAALRLLGTLPSPSEAVLQALEEQVVVDDDNRPVVHQVLAALSPSRAMPGLEASVRGVWGLHPEERTRLHEGLFALRVLAGMGARAKPAVGLLRELHAHALLRGQGDPVAPTLQVQVESVLDGIVRGEPPPPERRTRGPGSPRLARALEAETLKPEDAEHPPEVRLVAWLEALGPLEREEEVRLGLAVARQVVGLWDAHAPASDGAQSALLALEQWVDAPSEPHRQAALEVGYYVPSQLLPPEPFHAAWCISYATLALGDESLRQQWATQAGSEGDARLLGPCVLSAFRALTRGARVTVEQVGEGALLTTPHSPASAAALLHRALRDEVLPWARGEWDPVRDVRRERRRWLAGDGLSP